MSSKKTPSRTSRKTRAAKTSSQLSVKNQPVKECTVIVARLSDKVIPANSKQTATTDAKQAKNNRNARASKKTQENHKSSKESSTNLPTSTETSAPFQNLRTRKRTKYEESMEMSKCDDKSNVQKVPVYKQDIKDVSIKRKADLYEFDSDSEKYKKRKRRKLENSSMEEYNTAVKKIMNNINKTKKKTKNVVFWDKKEDTGKQRKTAKLKKQENNNNVTNSNQISSKVGVNKTKGVKKSVVTSKSPDKIVNNQKDLKSANQTSEKDAVNKDTTKLNDTFKNNLVSTRKHYPHVENEEIVIDNNNDDGYFGFAAAETDKSPKIDVISNVQLEPRKEWNVSIASPRLFKNGEPDANSTMVNNVLTPWRFNEINVRRNPHFITLKQSSLPCINQEMVLDHTIVDKLNESSKQKNENLSLASGKKSVKKTSIQAKIDDYISSNIENKENNENELSLFDNDQFSPIKCRTRSTTRSNLVKRKILCERNSDESENKSGSNQNLKQPLSAKSRVIVRNSKELTNFGFDSLDYSDKENSPVKEKDDRPFRLSVNVNDKKYDRKKKPNMYKEESLAGSEEESDASEYSDEENKNREIKLFEDFDNTRELVEEEKAVKKKNKKVYFKDKDFQKPMRRRDIRTKEEEEEVEKWAAAFNSMCEEIEQFPLEIE